jgi:N-acetylmuramoyl-L-alanine amidase
MAAIPWRGGVAQAQYRTISWGARGDDVAEAQAILREWGYYGGPVDGIFGPRMSRAVRLFQSRNGLTADGVVGPATWAAMGITVAPARAPAAPGGAEGGAVHGIDVELLARLLRAEAEAEPYEGKVAVAAVLFNRVRDSRFPNTLEGVIYEPWAFESVENGRIYHTPPRADDYQAARDARNGWDPTHGSVFFWNPYKPVTPWIWSRPIVTQIGDHVFAR